jgi:peptidoglycan-associated lipoprotein
MDYLTSLGVPADRLKLVSYGKEVPLCQQSNEECWARNRRVHFAVTGKVRQ